MKNGLVTRAMNEAHLAVIYKKGSTEDLAIYRPIALLNLAYKILAAIIQRRLSSAMEERIDKLQFGFRRKISTLQPLFIYRRAQEIHEESGQELITLLLDWEKAFDRIDQERMLVLLERMGVPQQFIKIIASIYETPTFAVKEGNITTYQRRQRAGIRQGCPLSPYLFIIVLTAIIKDIEGSMSADSQARSSICVSNSVSSWISCVLLMMTSGCAVDIFLLNPYCALSILPSMCGNN